MQEKQPYINPHASGEKEEKFNYIDEEELLSELRLAFEDCFNAEYEAVGNSLIMKFADGQRFSLTVKRLQSA